MNGALQTGGFVFALIGFVLGMIAIILPEWRVNDPRGDIIEAIFLHQGLWARCVAQTTGQWQCDDWDAKFLGLSAELQVARSLAIICVFFGIGALLLSVLGLECSSCLSDSISTKSKVSQLASALWIGAGITVGAAVSFYAHQVIFKEILVKIHFSTASLVCSEYVADFSYKQRFLFFARRVIDV